MRTQSFTKLLQAARLIREMVYLSPLDNIKAVFGEFKYLLPPYHPYSEYNILKVSDWSSLKRLASFIADGAIPWYKMKEPEETKRQGRIDPLIAKERAQSRFTKAEEIILSEVPQAFLTPEGKIFPGEQWIYLNGIITDRNIAMMNGRYIAALFGRKVEVIHNPTDALVADLIETIAGRLWQTISRADQFAYEYLLAALMKTKTKKVVFIAHSQGTVIAANVLMLLRERHPNLLAKLEIYTMANCASHMEIKKDAKGHFTPYIEHFANTNDIICKLGISAKAAQKRGDVQIDGPVFVRDAWGHLLNTHYLIGVERKEYKDEQGLQSPRLYQYLGGGAALVLKKRGGKK